MADKPQYLTDEQLGIGKGDNEQAPKQYLKESDLGIEPEQGSNIARGFKTAMRQVPQTFGGAAALVGDAVGSKGLNEWGMDVYQSQGKKIQELSRDNDSFTKAISGDGNLADWAGYGAGYVGGQALQAAATGGAGAFVGKKVAEIAAKKAIQSGVERGIAKEVAEKAASEMVRKGIKRGASTGAYTSNLMQEAGSIYPEALATAKEEGRLQEDGGLSGADLVRAGGAAAGAAALDTLMEAKMLKGVLGGGSATDANMLKRIAKEAGKGAGREALTEGAQTGIERWGAQQSLGDKEAVTDYIDSAAMGALGGAMGGAGAGVRSPNSGENPASSSAINNEAATPAAAQEQPLQFGNTPDPLISFRDGTVARQSEIDAHLASLSEDERSAFTAQIMGYAPQQAETAAPVDTPFNQPTPPARIDRAALARQGAYPVEPTPAPVLDTRRLSEKLGLSNNRGGLEAAAAMAVDSGASPISQAVNTNAFQQVDINGAQTQEAQQAVAGQSQGAGAQERVAAAPKIRAVKLKDGTTAHVNEADLTSGASLLRTFTADGKPRAVRLPAANIAPAAPKVVLQNRNRATPASIAQMNAIASKPDFLRTGASNTMDNGAPIVFGDLPQKVAIGRAQMVADGNGQRVPTQYAVVEAQDLITSNHADGSPVAEYANGVDGKLRAVAGNGRAAGLKAAWQRGTAGQYGQELMQDAPNLGIAPDVLAQFEAPVLVRVMDAADVTPDMGDRSNVQAGLQMSAVEQASNDAQRLNLRDMEFDELGNPTAQTVMRFMQGMPVQERGNMLDSQGRATSQLLDRIRAAAFKQAYMSDSLVELAAQSADPEAKNILNGLAIVAGDMAQLAGAGDFDIRQAVTDAANMAVTAGRTGQSIAQYLQTRQIDENPETVVVMQFMAQNVRSAKRIADGLRAWAELAQGQIAIARQNAEQDTMFGDTPTLSRRELFERLNNDNLTEIEQQQLIEQQRRAELTKQGTQRPGTERAGNADGASDGAESRGTEPTNAQDAGREQADFALEQQTPEQILAQEEAQAQAARDKAQADARAAEAERKAVERQEVTQRSEAAANDFQLGQSAEDNLSGQGDIFAGGAAASSQAAPYQYFEEKTGIIRDIPAMTTRDGSLNEGGKRLAYTEWRDMSDNEKALFHEAIAARKTRSQQADDSVRKEYLRAEKARLEGERIILSSNGNPYKTEGAAAKFIEEKGIEESHYAGKVDGGWAAVRRTPSEMLTRENEKKGIEDYTTIQERIVGEMGLTQAWSQDAITDAQWEEIDKRVDAIQRQQRGLPAIEQPPQPATPPKTLKEGIEQARAKKAAEKAEKTANEVPVKNEKPAAARDSAESNTETATAVNQPSRPDKWRGNKLQAAKVARDLGLKLDIPKVSILDLVRAIDAHDAKANGQEVVASPAKPKKNTPLAVGNTPSDTEKVTVRDGTVFLDKYEAIDYESGEPVTVPKGSTRGDVVKALRDAGAISKNTKVFGASGEQANDLAFSRRKGASVQRSFAGEGAATADKMALSTAQERISAGEDAERVRQETGWHKGVDGKWRFEISDADAKYVGKDAMERAAQSDPYKMAEMRLEDVLDHPALFAAYPVLRDVSVAYEASSAADGDLYYGADYNAKDNVITLGNGLDEGAQLSALLHEIQHGIQSIEGFATGSSIAKEAALGELSEESRKRMRQLVNIDELAQENNVTPSHFAERSGAADDIVSTVKRWVDAGAWDSNIASIKRNLLTAGERYRQSAGEVEARNTQARQKMTEAERRATTPSATADVADADVIVTFNGKDAAFAPPPANALRAQPKGASVATIRHAASRAYGKLLERLEAKGLVHVAQTEEDALQAAAKARAAKTGQSVGEALEGLRQSVQNSIAVWHGTPHRGIEKTGFKLNKIGTGDGAQSYGWGIYFASMREVAQQYQPRNPGAEDAMLAEYNAAEKKGDWESLELWEAALLHNLSADIQADDAFSHIPQAKRDAVARKMQEIGKKHADGGNLYEVALPIEESDLLDWGKLLTEQPEKVQRALFGNELVVALFDEAKPRPAEDGWPAYEGLTGDALYYALARELSGETIATKQNTPLASQYLQSIGIPGMRYLDDNSRSVGQGSHNYVIWDEALLTSEAAQIDAKFSKDGAIEGFFDRQTGKSFLVADGLTEETAPATLMHEVGIHMAADGSMQGVFNRAAMLVKNSKDEFMNRVRDRMEAAGETSAEEAAAYIVTEYEKDRTNAPASIKQFMKDFMAAVRAWLFRNGFTQVVKEGNLTPADISAIARANARSLANGANRADTAQNSRQNLAFSEVGSVDGAALQRQFDETARAYGGQDAYAKAKADGKTKLNYGQWVQVRTPNFKAWFGDWENDPANASKVVDSETGEPMVAYHGGRQLKEGAFVTDNSFGGIFTNPDYYMAAEYAEQHSQSDGAIYSLFLNIRNPTHEEDVAGRHQGEKIKSAKLAGHDGIIMDARTLHNGKAEHESHVFFNPNQAKSAGVGEQVEGDTWFGYQVYKTQNIGTFRADTSDILFSRNPYTQSAQNTADSRASTAAQNPSNPSKVWAAIEGMFEGIDGLRQRLDAGTTVVRSSDELPQQFQQAAKDAQAQGFYDDKSKRIYLVADRIEAGQEKAVWLHEVFHKRGSELLGDTVMARLHGAVQRWSTRKAGSVERQIYDAAHARAQADGNYNGEFLAYAIEEAVNRGVQPDLKTNIISAGYWLGRVREAFANAMAKLTGAKVNSVAFSAKDLVAAAYGAAGLEVAGKGAAKSLRAEAINRLDEEARLAQEAAAKARFVKKWGNGDVQIPNFLPDPIDSHFSKEADAWVRDTANKLGKFFGQQVRHSGSSFGASSYIPFGLKQIRVSRHLNGDMQGQSSYHVRSQKDAVELVKEVAARNQAQAKELEAEKATGLPLQFSRAYGGQDAYDKAKADGKTKLNYGQWVQVRTPAFKAWFGDWEAVQGATMERRAKTLESAVEKAKAFVNAPLTNKATGLVAKVSNGNLGKMSSESASRKSTSHADHSLAIANVDKLFANAVLDHSHADARGEPTIAAIHRYMAPMINANGQTVLVKMTVKETTGKNEPNPLYSIEAMEIENPPSALSHANPNGVGIRPQAGLSANVQELLAAVNTGASEVTDPDTGEPMVVYHGTDWDIFGEKNQTFRGATFFTTSERIAQGFGGNVVPAFVNVRNGLFDNFDGANYNGSFVGKAEKPLGRDVRSIVIDAKNKQRDGVYIEDVMPLLDRPELQRYEDGESFASDWIIAFTPTQIKSATGNSGAFDSKNPDIRFSRASPTTGAGVWQSPEPTKFDQWTYLLQDKQIDTKRVLNAIKSTGQQVDDAQDVYLQETLYHGRTAKRVKDFAEQEERQLMELMRDKGLSLGQVEEYLHARHAPEANKALAERNPSAEVIAANLKAAQAAGDDGEAAKWRNAKPYTGTEEDRLALSGMSDAEAAAVMAALTPEQRTNLQAAAEMVDAIIAKTRQTFVDYGLETQETVDAWGKAWAHYVPLMREQPEDTGMAGMGTGQGFSVKGKETKGRTGSTKKVVDILANINMQRERAIVRGEKNRVAMALLGLVKANPNKDFWRVATAGEVPSSKVVDERTGLVRTQIDPLYKSRDNALVVKVDGQEQVILFNEDNARAMRMAAALKNMDAANLEGMLGNVASVTRYLAAINTQYNPIFGIVNMVRDFQEAAINLQATPLAGKQKQVLGQALTAVWQVGKELRAQREGKTTGSEWGKLWEDFQAHGGQTGYRDMFTNSADRSRALQALLQPDAWADTKWGKFFSANGTLKAPMEFVRKTALRPLLDLLSDYNEAIENGVRLSAYKTAIEQGMSRERAAELAKNLTVNFNRKGQVAQQIGALYAFFNASVQGTARMGQTLFNMEPGQPKTMRLSPLGKKIVGGAVLLGSVQALLLAAAGFGEDEPPEFIRERNLVIPNPLADKGYTTIPMPLGYHVLANLGRIPTEYALGGFKGGAKRAVSIVDVLADIYNPLGGGGLSMQTISPTVLDPFAALAENKDFTGRPIAKESFNKTTPGHALGRDTSSFLANGLSQAINYATGGTEYTRGELSPTPDQIDYLLGQALGGVGREASKVSQTAQALATGDDLPWHKVPLIGRFYGSADTPAAVQSAYYATMDDVRRHAAEVKGLRNDGRGQEAVAYMQANPQAGMHFAANAAERQVKKLRERISDLKEQGAPREVVRAVETQMVEVMQRFSAAVENRKKLVSA